MAVETITISRKDVEPIIRALNRQGEIFTVEATKRSTGERRVFNGRLGVRKHLKGGQQKYDPKEKGLLVLYDNIAKGYRSVNLDGVIRIRARNKEFIVK